MTFIACIYLYSPKSCWSKQSASEILFLWPGIILINPHWRVHSALKIQWFCFSLIHFFLSFRRFGVVLCLSQSYLQTITTAFFGQASFRVKTLCFGDSFRFDQTNIEKCPHNWQKTNVFLWFLLRERSNANSIITPNSALLLFDSHS